MNKDFMNWLASGDKTPFRLQSENWNYAIIRIEAEGGLEYLYCQYIHCSDRDKRADPLKYVGIYRKCDGKVYDAQAHLCNVIGEFDPEAVLTTETMGKQLRQRVCEKVEVAVGNDRRNLAISTLSERYADAINYHAERKARKSFLYESGFEPFVFHCNYGPISWSEKAVLSFAKNPDGCAAMKAEEFWKNNQENMLFDFLCDEKAYMLYKL